MLDRRASHGERGHCVLGCSVMSLIGLPGAAGQRHPATRMIIVQYSMTARWHSFSDCLGTRSPRPIHCELQGHVTRVIGLSDNQAATPVISDRQAQTAKAQTSTVGISRQITSASYVLCKSNCTSDFANFKARKGGDHWLGRIKPRRFDRDALTSDAS